MFMNLLTNLTILFVMLETENVTIRQASQDVYCVKTNVIISNQPKQFKVHVPVSLFQHPCCT